MSTHRSFPHKVPVIIFAFARGRSEQGTLVQFLWQDDPVSISDFFCDCLDVMLGADFDDQSQTSDQPWVAGKV